MYRRLAVVTATAALLVGVIGAAVWSTDEEVLTLRALESVDSLKAEFNADSGKGRLLLLLSPT